MNRAELQRQLARIDAVPKGCSARELVWQQGKVQLYRYSARAPLRGPPLLIVYALVNRPYMMDLQADRSLIRALLEAGQDVYLIDWGYPDGGDRLTALTDYVDQWLHACVQQVCARAQVESLNLLGVCQGGVLSLCYTALHPQRIRNLVVMVTPVDFHTPRDLLSKWTRKIDIPAWAGGGNVSGDALNQLFLTLMPFRLTQQKYVQLLSSNPSSTDLENFLRLEQWVFDSPDQAGRAFCEFVQGCYQQNQLIRAQLQIGGRSVDLGTIHQPVLNLFGTRDHLVPAEASRALRAVIGSRDYSEREFDLGHIGMYVSSRAQTEVPAAISGWLLAR